MKSFKPFWGVIIAVLISMQAHSQTLTFGVVETTADSAKIVLDSIPGMSLAAFHYSVNDSTCKAPPVGCTGVDVSKTTKGKYECPIQRSFHAGDVIYYWIWGLVGSAGVQSTNLSYTFKGPQATNPGNTNTTTWKNTTTGSLYSDVSVGIGTSMIPTERLVVNGNLKLLSDSITSGTLARKLSASIMGNNTSAGRLSILASPSNDNAVTGPFIEMYAANEAWIDSSFVRKGDIAVGSYGTGKIGFFNYQGNWATSEKMVITSAGDVGIGIKTPLYKLDVLGTIHAKKVVVDLKGVADYVFHKDYKLMPLNEVEKYVNTTSHLPGIPSASQINENGLNIGEMQNKLLQKIEELTLYVIEQNKKIERLEKAQK